MLLTVSDSGGGSSQSGTDGAVVAGGAIGYRVTVANDTPAASTAELGDPVPAALSGVTWTATVTDGASAATMSGSGAITNNELTLPAGAQVTFTVTGTIGLSSTGTLTDSATLTPANAPVLTASDSDAVATLTMTDGDGGSSPSAAAPGGTTGAAFSGNSIVYQIAISNTGARSITTTLSDELPAVLQDSTWSAQGTSGASAATTSGIGNISDDALTLPASSELTFTIDASVSATATGTLSDAATLTPTGGDGATAVDTDAVAAPVVPAVTVTDDGGASSSSDAVGVAVAGGQIIYQVVVGNTDSSATTASLSEPVPSDLTDVTWSAAGAGGATATSGSGSGEITNDSLTLPAGSHITFTITGTVAASATGTLTDAVSVTPAHTTAVQASVSGSITTLTLTDDDGGSSVTGAQGTAIAGAGITYTIGVTNTGASGVETALAYVLAAEVTNDTWSVNSTSGGAQASSSDGTGNLSDDLTLPAGSTITFVIGGTVSVGASGTLDNACGMFAEVSGLNQSGGDVSETDDITQSATLTTAMTDSDGGSSSGTKGSVAPDGSITYTITFTNSGPSNATGVSANETLPIQGLENESSPNLPNGVSFDATTGLWAIGTIDAGSSVTVELSGTVPSNATGATYVNQVIASSQDSPSSSATDTDNLS
jgi:uncharacterized repeat protein (TIGR01451 family)